MSRSDTIRKEVSQSYAKAVTTAADDGGCCGGSPTSKGVAAKLAGYTTDELNVLPTEAVVNSFGCGNPLAFSGVKPGDVVLDLGSGAGIDLLLAAKKVGPEGRAIGVDMTDEMIAKAEENIRAANLENVEVRKGIIEALPVEDNSVDWVISNCVINLSPEKAKVFSEISRVLKPGGQMLVSDIMVEHLSEELRQSKELYSSCIAGAIPEKEYLQGLRDAGLTDVEVRDRLVYDQSHITGLVDSEVDSGGCCGTGSTGSVSKLASAELKGQIWSANVYARKA
jgi:SAM-dependent methyltransferase